MRSRKDRHGFIFDRASRSLRPLGETRCRACVLRVRKPLRLMTTPVEALTTTRRTRRTPLDVLVTLDMYDVIVGGAIRSSIAILEPYAVTTKS